MRAVPEPPLGPAGPLPPPGGGSPAAAGPSAAAVPPAAASSAAESVLGALDPEQQQVALATRGPVCVLAGAGTGKTRAIAHRIAYAVLTGVVDPGHVLAVTFTTRAAGELRARLHQLGGPGGALDRVQARTFHSAALRQLTHFWPQTVGGRPPTVLDSKVRLLAEAARQARISTSSADLRDLASEIEWAKVTQVRPEEYPRICGKAGRVPPLGADVVARLYARYEELRTERHLVDFESVLELTAAILAEHQVAAAAIRDRYRYFVVDEYQDVNPLQKLLLDSWAHDRDDVCVVGDPRQTIYSFAGATAAYLTGFTTEFPDAAVVRLVRNYRSSPQVVALANQLTGAAGPQPLAAQLRPAAARPQRTAPAPALVAQRAPGPAAEFTEYPDEQREASAIAARIHLLGDGGADLRQIAVLVRTNAQTLPLERAFADLGIPCQVRGAERFFDRAEVRQATGLLRGAAKSASPARGAAPAGGPAPGGAGAGRRAGPGRGCWPGGERGPRAGPVRGRAARRRAGGRCPAHPGWPGPDQGSPGWPGLGPGPLGIAGGIGPARGGLRRRPPRGHPGRVRGRAGPPLADRARPGPARRHPDIPARGEGPGVGYRLPAGPDRREPAHRVRADRGSGRGGAQAAVRGRHPGPGAAVPVLAGGLVRRRAAGQETLPVPRRPPAAGRPAPGRPEAR